MKIYEKLVKIKTEGFDPTLIYIQYMKFSRRTESITSARGIFKRAREDPRCNYEIYSSAALMEYYCSKVGKLFYFLQTEKNKNRLLQPITFFYCMLHPLHV